MTQKWELESSEMDSYLLCVLWKDWPSLVINFSICKRLAGFSSSC